MRMVALLHTLQLIVTLFGYCLCAPPKWLDVDTFDLENHTDGDADWENYTEMFYYEDPNQEQIQAGSEKLSPPPPTISSLKHTQEVTVPQQPSTALMDLDFCAPGLFGSDTGLGMPTCLLCVCVSTSVYCDDSDLTQIPPLPKETTYFYARFNHIKHIKATDFANLNRLQRLDLTGNDISEVDPDALHILSGLQELQLPDNQLRALPELPNTLRHIDLRNNQLTSAGLHQDAFKDMTYLEFLYLSHNQLDNVPGPLPESLRVLHLQYNNIQSFHEDTFCNRNDAHHLRHSLEDIRLDGNPVNLSHFASSYICLPRVPVGRTL